MSKTYTVIQKTIVRAPNMAEAKKIAETNDGLGDILNSDLTIEESTDRTQKAIALEKWADEIEDEEVPFFNDGSITSDFLRAENKRLNRLAEKYKNVATETHSIVYRAAFDAFSNFELPKLKRPNFSKSSKVSETAVAVLADWQLGKVTPDYNSNVAAERIELYMEKLLEITEIQRAHHPVKDLHVWLLGDIVEGEEIFPGQSHLIDSGLYRQVGVNGPEILSNFLSTALENFEHVHVVGVIGNHGSVGGRNRRQYDPETNMDRLLYKIMSLIFAKEDRITFNIPDGRGERSWYAVDEIGKYKTLLIHGDQLPHPTSVNGYYKRVLGWKDGAIPEHFDDVFMGHYHQQFKITIGSTIVRVSGSPESYNTYAQEYFNSMSRPCQHLMYIHPENGITSEYSVWLD
jgi:hypothetical protein